ncbi:ABC-2 type transport system permease protein [Leucobacter exalbidus]|uniref:Transport permease protein n=1 Tax=Leucobacter exalbidus TaxID=662960 RepID=A0A940T3S4_9MICO|nr:ABC-2 type transport system permease protein [Leucobacter exalbidus]
MTQHPALSDPEYSTPGTSRGLISGFQHRYLLSLLLKKGVITRYYGSALGWAWSYIRPLAQFFMYYVVIGILLGVSRGVEYFPVYLFSGIIMVNLFSETFRSATDSIVGNRALIQKVYLPRELFPLANVGGAIIHFAPQAVVLFLISVLNGWHFEWIQPVAFICAVLIVVLFGLGLGLFFGALNVLYRDSKNFVDLILMFATWTSPVLYPFIKVKDRAPEWIYNIYMSNPLTAAVELSHGVFWAPIASGAERPEGIFIYAAIAFGIAIFALIIGQLVFRKLEGKFAQNL